jgi:uncharacterized membrane protein YgdD (TMEM256/DUF423 family)
MKNKNFLIAAGGIFGFLGVAIGAFGSHGLRDILTPDKMEIFKTGVFYQLIHSIAILAIGFFGEWKYYNAALLFSAGIVLFSFSIYSYAISGIGAITFIIPAGGICFLIGWLLIIINAIKPKKFADS